MIIVDMNQVMISTFMVESNNQNVEVDEGLIRHMVLNSLRANKVKYGEKYGEMVLACDDQNYWRKQMFPYYKFRRKEDREASSLDWNAIFNSLNKIRDEIKEVFPYRTIQIESAEADDVIATLVKEFGNDLPGAKRILILSGDKDFQQLQRYDNVDQIDPVHKKTIKATNPELFLKEHIIRGDVGDGVPNFLSDDNCLAIKVRQKSIMQKKLDVWLTQDPSQFCDAVMLERYERNRRLIDLSLVPDEIAVKVMESYHAQEDKIKDRSKLFNYFMKHKLKLLMNSIQEF